MSDMNESKIMITQGQEPSIEVGLDDVIDEQEEKMVTAPEGEEAPSVDPEKAEPEEEEEKSEKPDEAEEATEEKPAEETQESNDEAEKPVEETEKVDADEVGEDNKEEKEKPSEEAETEAEETSEDVDQPKDDNINDIKAELAALQEEKEINTHVQNLQNVYADADRIHDNILNNLQLAINQTLEANGIDPSKSLEELKDDETKFKVAQGIIAEAMQVKEAEERKLSEAVAEKEREAVFKVAENEFKKYEMTDEQKEVAADTFVRIFAQVGMADLKDDLKTKVKLSVAQAKMDKPEVKAAVVEEKVEEENKKEEKVDTAVSETPSEKIEEEKVEKEEVKSDVPPATPDISDFKESAAPQTAAAPASINVDNILDKLAALPFKERTQFLMDNMDIYNEAMRIKRANA